MARFRQLQLAKHRSLSLKRQGTPIHDMLIGFENVGSIEMLFINTHIPVFKAKTARLQPRYSSFPFLSSLRKHKSDTSSFVLLYPEVQPITQHVLGKVDLKFHVIDLVHGALVEVCPTLPVGTLLRGILHTASIQRLWAAAAATALMGPLAATAPLRPPAPHIGRPWHHRVTEKFCDQNSIEGLWLGLR